jgi:hypothetical protein
MEARMGPHFNAAATTIARQRLPPGLVAILDNPGALRATIGELHAYANANRTHDRPRRGIVFRIIEEWERRALMEKLWNYFGARTAPTQEKTFNVVIGHMHIIDDSAVSHACNRHGVADGEDHGLSLSVLDFMKIPETVDPRHVVEFSIAKGMPRLVYRKHYDQHSLVVVQELQQKTGLVIKTVYKRK